LLSGAVPHLWQASMMFGKYLEFCEDNGREVGCDPLSGERIVVARPADVEDD
jgi:hypothetical protein